jgi:hypothetical protein
MVAAGDGAPPSPAGYCYYLVAHAIATALLLTTLTVAVWQFMDWVVTPSCLQADSSQTASAQVTPAPASSGSTKAEEIRTSGDRSGASRTGWAQRPVSYRTAARTDTIADGSGCPCPNSGR